MENLKFIFSTQEKKQIQTSKTEKESDRQKSMAELCKQKFIKFMGKK
jgi:hypothetical protein